ncbi:MAG: hypothetical protein N3I35_10695 [Clostridia bacterium]|nr:hypothetical protein [Clostridia bacterium]
MSTVFTEIRINIHTIEFSYNRVSETDHEKLMDTLKPAKQNRTNAEVKIFKGYSQFKGIRYQYVLINKHGFQNRVLKVIVNPMNVLNKQDLLIEDLDLFLKRYNFFMIQEFSLQTLSYEMFSRVDYYIDFEFEPIIKEILLRIYKKAPSNYKGLRKTDKYKSSVYYNSKSRQVNIYSRYQKIVNKLLEDTYSNPSVVDVKTEVESFVSQKDKNTIRFEVQIKRKKIMYYLKKEGICPELINYWNYRDAAYFISDILKPIIQNGNYYNSYHSRRVLMEYYGNKKFVDRIIRFQNYLSNYGYDKAKVQFKNYNKYIRYLAEAGVNPYLIPYNTGITYTKNPIKFLSSSIEAYRIPAQEWTGLINVSNGTNKPADNIE